jgi:crotonobetainyl-CoA hydratase
MWHRRTPVIAAVNGLALGGGFELALAADLIVAAEHAEVALPEVTLGLVADSGGLLRLRRVLPQAVATEMLLTGRRMAAEEAARWGLVNRVARSEDLLDSALDLARAVIGSAPLAVAAVLEVEQEIAGGDVRAGFERMRSGALPTYRSLLGSADALEGPRAFAEKRPPRWVGHQTVQRNQEGTS